jgi:TetR/AcrR family tetracycline transcriptional repressor
MDLELSVEQILDAALAILREEGLDAVSMRNVSARLGVSPVPVYNRIGNKDALLDALAAHLVANLAPPVGDGEAWPDYARRWSRSVRTGLQEGRDARLTLRTQRAAYVEASRPLIAAMRAGGISAPSAVQACRLLTWAIVGFVALEHQVTTDGTAAEVATRGGPADGLPGGRPEGVTADEADELFELHIRYLVEGIVGDAGAAPTPRRRASTSARARRST